MGVSGLEVFETWIGSTRATAGTAVGLARGIDEGPALRLGGGALVRACAVRWRLSKTTGTLKATVEIPSYNRHIER